VHREPDFICTEGTGFPERVDPACWQTLGGVNESPVTSKTAGVWLDHEEQSYLSKKDSKKECQAGRLKSLVLLKKRGGLNGRSPSKKGQKAKQPENKTTE